MSEAMKFPGQLVFGLDIGTRSIVGTVGYMEKDHFVVVAQKVREHETRAMLDGQIHDIGAVGEVIRDVTDELEKELDITLSQVCIAAAGRVLQTVTTSVEIDLEGEKLITKEDIFALDSYGIEKAYEEFQKEVFQRYLEKYGITKDQVVTMFDDEDAVESFEDESDRCFADDMEALGICVEDNEIVFEDKVDSDGWELRDLLEELGWDCSFEGEQWKFETNGVYFIR